MTSTQSNRPRVNSPEPFAPRPRPGTPAHLLESDEEAVAIAQRLAEAFSREAAERDREGYLPTDEIDQYSQSGLWGLNVPREYGGLGASYSTIAWVTSIIAGADSSIAQIAHNHLSLVSHIAVDGSDAQKRELFGLVLQGYRFGNAFSELHSRTVAEFATTVVEDGDEVVVNGEKFYTTGALLAHIVPIVAVNGAGQAVLVFADRDAPGLTVVNNWSSFGQRTTASGAVKLDNVRVPKSRAIVVTAFDQQTAAGAISQVIQAAIDVGIARRAIDETIAFVREQSRPWIDSDKATAAEDPFTIQAIGDLKIRLHAAEALLERAGHRIDAAVASPDEASVALATTVTAEAKVLTTQIAIEATNRLFELAGTRSTLQQHNLDRYWRNARVHTLHDPVRWKYFHIGNYYLNGINPPRNAWN
ncbi:SfnB family sulfur acquisition oxidoreductase [Stutzerimonas kirkiae]|uniref:Dibenzothiophene monooxygenase n=1 Tax=Stutzerimonas kirkiae TaxID=2211392 RepID=A0A4Q9RCK6_9GAMM|nr:SfnB family sulfur acquisition oxidoreductase [Stutzerimonas kirkiae]TBU98625.1 SfnB family sulfur acquisition oxidoreductase [Stutzerimonas kirkiae]TBV04202.1 SfnB family sulfur acquisition oxidoreductase [Stutzerimonas kirkiae]TBV10906.1 SfnB family sulfur acquisition oxidoreductase [Stutzerimonas kirkiae]TBV14266.1 SfnB family sulfur acquisition oxidoreductase [Stutzerimonas kirkiae]